jgi:hypothetical protein
MVQNHRDIYGEVYREALGPPGQEEEVVGDEDGARARVETIQVDEHRRHDHVHDPHQRRSDVRVQVYPIVPT